MKKSKRSSSKVKTSKGDRAKLFFLVGSVVLIAAIMLYGALQKAVFTPNAAPRKGAIKTTDLTNCISKWNKDRYFQGQNVASYDPNKIYPSRDTVNKCGSNAVQYSWFYDFNIKSGGPVYCCMDVMAFTQIGDSYCTRNNYDLITTADTDRTGKIKINNFEYSYANLDMRCKSTCGSWSKTDPTPLYKSQISNIADLTGNGITGAILRCNAAKLGSNPTITSGYCCYKGF